MVLFVSDMHFGPSAPRTSESALIGCLEAHRNELNHLILGGDVFDAYIEYPSLVPKGCTRFLGYLAELSDRGVRISYLLGNHDCWHLDYFETELGVRVYPDHLTLDWHNLRVCAAHGDAAPGASTLQRFSRYLLRHRVPGALYRYLLPGDLGLQLARLVKRRLDARPESAHTLQILRTYARQVLEQDAFDLVILGHSHKPELLAWPEGLYANAGSWRDGNQFVMLSRGQVQLRVWNGQAAETVDFLDFPRTRSAAP